MHNAIIQNFTLWGHSVNNLQNRNYERLLGFPYIMHTFKCDFLATRSQSAKLLKF